MQKNEDPTDGFTLYAALALTVAAVATGYAENFHASIACALGALCFLGLHKGSPEF